MRCPLFPKTRHHTLSQGYRVTLTGSKQAGWALLSLQLMMSLPLVTKDFKPNTCLLVQLCLTG